MGALALEDSIAERVATALTLALAREERRPQPRRYTAERRCLRTLHPRTLPVDQAHARRAVRGGALLRARHRHRSRVRAGLRRAERRLDTHGIARGGLAELPAARGHAQGARGRGEGAGAGRHAVRGARGVRPGAVRLRVEARRRNREPERAIELNPNNQNAHALVRHGARRARAHSTTRWRRSSARGEIDPLSVIVQRATSASCCIAPAAIDEAVAKLRHTVAMEPAFAMTRYRLGLALEALRSLRRGDRAVRGHAVRTPRSAGFHRPSRARARSWASRPRRVACWANSRSSAAPPTCRPPDRRRPRRARRSERALEYLERGVEERAIIAV